MLSYDPHASNRPALRLAAVVIIAALAIGAFLVLLATTGDRSADTDLSSETVDSGEAAAAPTVDESVAPQAGDAPVSATTTTEAAPSSVSSSSSTPASPTPSSTPASSAVGTGGTVSPGSSSSGTGSSDAATRPVSDAEAGIRFDYGDIVQSFEADGATWIRFDRWGFTEQNLQGPDHITEPSSGLATDFHGGSNTSPRLRTYRLADDATVLVFKPQVLIDACDGVGFDWDQELYDRSDVGSMLAADADLASLTFNAGGEVTVIRDQRGC